MASLLKLALHLTALVAGMGLGASWGIRPGGLGAGPFLGAGIRFGRERVQGRQGAIRWGFGGRGTGLDGDLGAVTVAQTRPPAWEAAGAGREVADTVGVTGWPEETHGRGQRSGAGRLTGYRE